ncbi:uncharacterized protein [Dermacentor albipictus]|uniref:uncharacterized protein n=1 Tax=Dermacentor albipictus TaxID=60249 RepID=UPI0031FDD2FD
MKMANGNDCCVLCSLPFSEMEEFMRCASCNRRAHLDCITWTDAETKLMELAAGTAHPPDIFDNKLAALRSLLEDAHQVISHLKHEMITLRDKNEHQRDQLEQDRLLQAQLFAALKAEMRAMREEFAKQRVPPPLQPQQGPRSEPTQGPPRAEWPAFNGAGRQDDFLGRPSTPEDVPRR